MTILITGATGCVGSYLVREMLENSTADLLLAVRNPRAVPADIRENPRVRLHRMEMSAPELRLPDLAGVTAAVLVATAWGGEDTVRVIRDANVALADRLIAEGCDRILYFATASVLDRHGAMLEAARDMGTDYVRGKYALTEAMEGRADRAEVIGLFPTLVVGGTPDGQPARLSHFANLLHQMRGWVWLARFLRIDARLHMIHAADIATVVRHLATAPAGATGKRRLVLGNPADSVLDLVAAYCAYLGMRARPVVTLRPALAEAMIRTFRIRLSPWDRYCMLHPDQSYDDAVNPADFGLPVAMPDLRAGLRMIGVEGRAEG